MGTTHNWRFNIEELGKHFQCQRIRQRKPMDFDYTSKGYARFVIDFMDARKIEKAVLVGNSLGGQIAIKTCLEYTDRVSTLVLIDSGGYPGSVRFSFVPAAEGIVAWPGDNVAGKSYVDQIYIMPDFAKPVGGQR